MAIHTLPALAAHPGYTSGARYPVFPGAATSVAVSAVDVIYFTPFMCLSAVPLTKISLWVTTGGAGSSAKMAVWAADLGTKLPIGAPLGADNTGVATTSSAANADSAAMTVTLSAGAFYWFGAKFTGTLPSVWSFSNANGTNYWHGSRNTNSTPNQSFADAYANALPTFTGASSFTNHNSGCPQFFMVT